MLSVLFKSGCTRVFCHDEMLRRKSPLSGPCRNHTIVPSEERRTRDDAVHFSDSLEATRTANSTIVVAFCFRIELSFDGTKLASVEVYPVDLVGEKSSSWCADC